MKAQRPLIVGMTLATLWIVAYATWHLARERGDDTTLKTQADVSSHQQQSKNRDDNVLESSGRRSQEDLHAQRRRQMVEKQLAARDITDRRVLKAMATVPRHAFVPPQSVMGAYADGPMPIGHGQTISQPYIVALMTQLAQTGDSAVALDVGTGSGYQAAVLSLVCKKVYSIEIVESLAESARERLGKLGYRNVVVRHGDGYRGWPEHAPFDLIIVAAAPDHVPQLLVDQLKPGGRLVIPVGKYFQNLLLIEKQPDGTARQRKVIPVAFVPMTGEARGRKGKSK